MARGRRDPASQRFLPRLAGGGGSGQNEESGHLGSLPRIKTQTLAGRRRHRNSPLPFRNPGSESREVQG